MVTIDTSLKSFIDMLSDLRKTSEEIPPNITNFVAQQLSAHKKVIKDHIESFESKLKHCNQSIESLHTKTNIMDTQLKSIEKSINTGNDILPKNRKQHIRQ